MECISGCCNNNPKAQETLFRAIYPYAMNIAVRYSTNEADAADVLSLAFARIFRKIQTFDAGKGFFLAWVKRIVINEAITYNRKTAKRFLPIADALPGDRMVTNDALERLDTPFLLRLIRMLPPVRRTIFNLYVIEGYAHAEISKLTKLNENTCRWHLAEARKQLQQQLQKCDERIVRL